MRFNFGINQIVVQTNEKKEFIIITVKSGFIKDMKDDAIRLLIVIGGKNLKKELICKITDRDIGETPVEMTNPQLRIGARGIVIREDGKIAIFNKSSKNEYKLPGGGLEGEEKPEEAFRREVLEETGCEIEILECLGTAEEYKSLNNFKQISYIFVGKVLKDTKQLHVTQKEKEEGAKLLWETPENAIKLITKSYNELIASKYGSVYSTKFVVLRDRKILERWINYRLLKFILKGTIKNINIRTCTTSDVDSIYNIQNIVIDNFKEEEKGYFLPFKKETYLRIVNEPINDGEIYGAFLDDKMTAWIFLSVSNRMKELKQMIPNLEGSCADIDGVIVLPEYRGYGLQKILVKHLEKIAKEKK